MRYVIFSILFSIEAFCQVGQMPYPIQFSIPEDRVVEKIPEKDTDFAPLIPGNFSTYNYFEESVYFHDYQRSYYALTWKKGGWDCLRHYEILASGCIPYFVGLENCSPNTMTLLPKELILEAMHLEGVSCGKIDHSKFNIKRYYEIVNELIAFTREHLTTRKMAQHLLDTMQYKGNGTVLFISEDSRPDYMRCLTLAGLKQALGNRVVDIPKIEHIYKTYPKDEKELYGRGFTYTKIIDDLPVDRENIEERIRNREFELVIYGSVHRGTPYLDLVKKNYKEEEIAYICGEDSHSCSLKTWHNFFLREFN